MHAPLAFVLPTERAQALITGIHVNQHACVALEMVNQQMLYGFGLCMTVIHGKVLGQDQVQVHMGQMTRLPRSQLVYVDPFAPAVALEHVGDGLQQ